ncbi:MAG: hypothetical protein GYB68_16300 [Chloroflexi bacterium]|nr:hypothetical protein [Chloroflexota bacterium]
MFSHLYRTIGLALAIALSALTGVGCITQMTVGETSVDQQVAPLDDASELDLTLQLGVGELSLSGGTIPNAVEAEITSNVDELRAELESSTSGSTAEVTLTQPNPGTGLPITTEQIEYRWDVTVNDSVPVDMRIDTGAGQAQLNLTDVLLRSLSLNLGAGETTIDLRGNYDQDVDASITGGIGTLTLLLPEDIGVEVTVSAGISTIITDGLTRDGDRYFNEAFEGADQLITIELNAGVGEINLIAGE